MAFIVDLVNFVILTSMLPLKNHDFSRLFPKIVEIHDLFMTIQVSDSDSGLFRFIHDCGHPEDTVYRETSSYIRLETMWSLETAANGLLREGLRNFCV